MPRVAVADARLLPAGRAPGTPGRHGFLKGHNRLIAGRPAALETTFATLKNRMRLKRFNQNASGFRPRSTPVIALCRLVWRFSGFEFQL